MACSVNLQVVSVTVNEMNLELHPTCSYDSVTLYDGPGNVWPVLVKLCTTVPSSPIKSTGSYLTVVFKTDGSENTGRFSLSWAYVTQGWFMSFIKHSIIKYNNSDCYCVVVMMEYLIQNIIVAHYCILRQYLVVTEAISQWGQVVGRTSKDQRIECSADCRVQDLFSISEWRALLDSGQKIWATIGRFKNQTGAIAQLTPMPRLRNLCRYSLPFISVPDPLLVMEIFSTILLW